VSNEQVQWELLHQNDAYKQALPNELSARWERCYAQNIDWSGGTFRLYSPAEFQMIRNAAVQCYAYSNRFFSQIKRYSKTLRTGFAIFDRAGCLLKLYGEESFLAWCKEMHIAPGTDWSEGSIGVNAISLGLERKEDVSVIGRENFSRLLVDTAIYFSPYLIDDNHSGEEAVLFGGVALITPLERQSDDYLMLTAAAANDVALHLFMSNSLYEGYSREAKGLISIDINRITGKKHILYHNASFFPVVGTGYESLYFQPVETMFDPLPKNEEFWAIIEEGREISDQNVKLSIKGEENTFIVSTEPYSQNHLNIRGIRFFITSAKDISSNVSKKIGNNALVTFNDVLGTHRRFADCLKIAKTIARSDSNVLILGESGVGKDIIAQAIHNASDRQDKPFIVVNCAALPRDLIASELFGYEGGAFTGSKKNGNIGKFELANGGTIFLDEIGDMPLDLQATLLRVIEQKSFMRLGSNTVTNINVKIIAATNANVNQLVEQKKFRADLFYRFTLRLVIPPLRERGHDIVLLAEHFIRSISARINKAAPPILSSEAKSLLCRLPWAGNVRELQNLIEGIVQFYSVNVIEPEIIEEYLGISDSSKPIPEHWPPSYHESISLPQPVSEEKNLTRDSLENALLVNFYNKTKTAQYLGISRKTLYRRMEEYGMEF
jgi:Transcriptional regulator containing PAS, AAA-type ATPase, and DNA-binding domains